MELFFSSKGEGDAYSLSVRESGSASQVYCSSQLDNHFDLSPMSIISYTKVFIVFPNFHNQKIINVTEHLFRSV